MYELKENLFMGLKNSFHYWRNYVTSGSALAGCDCMWKLLVHCCAGEDKGENNPFILLELSGCVHRGDSLFVGVGKFLHDVLLVFLLQYRNLRISHSYRKSERTH